ncbi:MAG: MerR family transcriptional regulator [Proteobacteria bacterium SG_bin5]|nr:MerR family transcriptional regulator [Sphingomonas sp.]OQW41409.1 MAG: MerR family transcriptional regulator [Proteobacteria bacterium SG_bin5]
MAERPSERPRERASEKAASAYRTIGELAQETGIARHILRYWESRFPQLRPLTRAGGRRYYSPEDAALVRRIQALLHHEGYTIRGVQALLAAEAKQHSRPDIRAVRDALVAALAADEV